MDHRVDVFKGLRPRASPRLLPPGEGQTAENMRLGSGSLEQWYAPLVLEESPLTHVRTLHRMRNDGDPFWLTFNSDIDVARGPVPNDALERTYYTGPNLSEPRMTYIGIAEAAPGSPSPADYRILGIPAPTNAPSVSGTALPDASVTGTMTSGSMVTNTLKADFCIEDNLPANMNSWFMGEDSGYDITGTERVFDMDFFVGQRIKVASVVDANTITITADGGGTYLAKTTQRDRTPGPGLTHFRTDDTGTSRDGHFRFYIPNGVKITIAAHGLEVDDVIRISSIPSTISVKIVQPVAAGPTTGCFFGAESDNAAGTAGSNTWPATPVSVAADGFWIAGARAYPFVDVWSDADGAPGTDMFTVNGNFSWILVERGGTDYDAIVQDTVARVYVYTHVSELGEEGPPSDASDEVTITADGSVTVGTFATPPSTHRNITHRRLYRAETGSSDTVFEFVTELAIATTSFVDNLQNIDLGEVLQTTSWEPPDETMIGITALPNGQMAGFFGKTLCFSEPYYPHAWPPEYQQAVEHDIVGLGVLPNGTAVLTRGPAYIASGDHPRGMSLRQLNKSQSCTYKNSIASTINSVIYACPDGLASIGSSGFALITQNHISKRQWQSDYNPTSVRGFWHDDKYFGFFQGGNEALEVGGFIFDAEDDTVGLTQFTTNVDTAYLDPEEDELYLVLSDDLAPMVVATADTGTETAKAMSSPNGSAWTIRTTPNIADTRKWRNATFIEAFKTWFIGAPQTVVLNDYAMKTVDGLAYAIQSPNTDPLTAVVEGFAYAPAPNFGDLGRILAFGSSGGDKAFSYSDDGGVTWSAEQSWLNSSECVACEWIGDRFISASQGGFMFSSPTGIGASSASNSWTTLFSSGFQFGQDHTKFLYDAARDRVILMDQHDIYYSDDKGVSWILAHSAPGNTNEDITYSPELDKYMAVASTATDYVITSTDGGVTWVPETFPQSNPQFSGITWSRQLALFIAVLHSGANQVFTSPGNGVWTARTAASSAGWAAVAAGGTETAHDIAKWNADTEAPLASIWKSGRVVCPYPLNLGAARIVADDYPVTFKLYNDQGTLVTTRTINDEEVFRLPSGYLTDWFELRLETSNVVRVLHVAETVEELLSG